MNKILGSIFAALALLVALPALAAAAAPVPTPSGTTMIMQASASTNGQQGMMTQSANGMRVVTPCPMLEQNGASSNMMYKQYPCGTPTYSNFMGYNSFDHDTVSWLGIMFVVTVVLVWVILLLVIALLWKHLQKHKHS